MYFGMFRAYLDIYINTDRQKLIGPLLHKSKVLHDSLIGDTGGATQHVVDGRSVTVDLCEEGIHPWRWWNEVRDVEQLRELWKLINWLLWSFQRLSLGYYHRASEVIHTESTHWQHQRSGETWLAWFIKKH